MQMYIYSVYLSLHDLPANTDDICPVMSSYPSAIVSSLTASASFRCRREWRSSLSRPGNEFETSEHNPSNSYSDIYSVDGWMDHLRKNRLVGWDEKRQCKNLCLLAIYRTFFYFSGMVVILAINTHTCQNPQTPWVPNDVCYYTNV